MSKVSEIKKVEKKAKSLKNELSKALKEQDKIEKKHKVEVKKLKSKIKTLTKAKTSK
jgi:hypothetical protein